MEREGLAKTQMQGSEGSVLRSQLIWVWTKPAAWLLQDPEQELNAPSCNLSTSRKASEYHPLSSGCDAKGTSAWTTLDTAPRTQGLNQCELFVLRRNKVI